MPWPKGKPQPAEMVAKRKTAYARSEVKAKMSEAKKGKPRSAEALRKQSETLRGHAVSEETRAKLRAHFTGRPLTDEQKAAIHETMRAKWQDPEYRARQSEAHRHPVPHRRGLKVSEATRAKLQQSHLGKRRTIADRLRQAKSISGEHHYNWRGGPLPSGHRGIGWHTIKRLVRERARGLCEMCGAANCHGWQLDVHHVIPYREMPISVEWACLALCRTCHVRAERGVIDTASLQAILRPKLDAMLQAE